MSCTIRYDSIEQFNVDSKAECGQLNLAHETKTKNAGDHLVHYRFKIREGSLETNECTMNTVDFNNSEISHNRTAVII